MPISKQRLIFRGRLLKDSDKIEIYKIGNLDVIHLVAKPGNLESDTNTEQNRSSQNQTENNRRGLDIRGLDDIIIERDRLIPSIFELPTAVPTHWYENAAAQHRLSVHL